MKTARRASFIFFTLFFLSLLQSCQTRTVIINNIPEREANEIIVILSAHNIDAEKETAPAATVGAAAEQNFNITVPARQVKEALGILNQVGLPRVKGTKLLDLFGAQGLVPSDMQDRIRFQEGLSDQLATTIRKMDGIIDANVQITFPQDGEDKPLTASVYVKHRGILDNPNSLVITKIKRLVASALPGLTLENVTVVADRALYSDLITEQPELEEERNLVSIWSVVVAKESALTFRLIFYAFLILLFLLLFLIGWMVWKCFPVIQSSEGGFKSLFSPTPYAATVAPEEKTEEEETTEEEGIE